jgi:hypothetical protein
MMIWKPQEQYGHAGVGEVERLYFNQVLQPEPSSLRDVVTGYTREEGHTNIPHSEGGRHERYETLRLVLAELARPKRELRTG